MFSFNLFLQIFTTQNISCIFYNASPFLTKFSPFPRFSSAIESPFSNVNHQNMEQCSLQQDYDLSQFANQMAF